MNKMMIFACALTAFACQTEAPKPVSAEPASCAGKAKCITTIIGSGDNALTAEAGTLGWQTPTSQPNSSRVGPDGKLYYIDWNNHMVRVWNPKTLKTDTIAGTGEIGDLGSGGPAIQARMNHPTDLHFLSDGSLLIAAWHNSKIKRIDLATGILTDSCGTGGRAFAGDGGPAAKAVLDLPASVVSDGKGNLLLLDQANQRIRMIDDKDVITTVLGDRWMTDTAKKDGKPLQDDKGYFLDCTNTPAADSDKFQVVKTTGADGTISYKRFLNDVGKEVAQAIPIPNKCSGFKGDGGAMAEAAIGMQFSQSAIPNGRIHYDIANDVLYIADSMNHRVRKVDMKTKVITTVAGSGDGKAAAGYSGDGGPATEAKLNTPVDIDMLPDGTLLIADLFNSCIRAVAKDGKISTFAGQCGKKGFSGDGGGATTALLNRPYGVSVDAKTGTVYIADTNNNRIRSVTP